MKIFIEVKDWRSELGAEIPGWRGQAKRNQRMRESQ